MRAVDAIMECLKAEGVENVFGIPGGANLPTYDALYDAGIRHVQCRHEQGAGHAAEGYAKASGQVGVALATSGPRRTWSPASPTPSWTACRPCSSRPGAHGADRHGRVPEGGHLRDHDADRQALDPDPGPARHPEGDPRGVPRRAHGPAGPVRRRAAGPLARRHPLRARHEGPPARLPADHRGQREADQARCQGARQLAPSGDLRRRRWSTPARPRSSPSSASPTPSRSPARRWGSGRSPRRARQWLGMLGMHGTRSANYAMDEADLIVAIGACSSTTA